MDRARAEAVRTLYLQMRNSAAAAIVVTTYMVGTAWAFTAKPVIITWLCLQFATQIWRELLIGAWKRRVGGDERLNRWADVYTAYMVVTGCLWGSTIFLFAHTDQPITVALTLCCLYGVSGGSVPGNAYNPPGLYALVGFMFAPVVAKLLATGRFEYVLLGAASGLFAVTMVAFCRVQARAIDESFRIRFENQALLQALEVEKAEAQEARQRADSANLAKSQFLAAASHDLRQPLYALSLFSASLDELQLDGDGRTVVGKIQDSIGVMESLFNRLLDLSKLEAGAINPRLEAVSIEALFSHLSHYFRPLAIARGLELRFRTQGECVLSDLALLEQVLANLIANALRYTARGGVLVAARRRGARVQLVVWDTGVGIGEADRERIFQEFVQLGNPERDRRKGAGLGLSIARRSAALLGAEITVASRVGRGSRFSLDQTAARAEAVIASQPNPNTVLPALTWRTDLPLLVVDDDPDVREALANLLRRWGFGFDTAADARDALALLDSGGRYGLVLADYRLSGPMDGLELIEALRRRQDDPAPAAVLITADFDPSLVARAHDRDVPLLTKPLQAGQLRALLGRS